MYFYLSDKGNAYNEDFVYVTENFGVLLDGAIGLFKEQLSNGNTDAQLFSHQLGRLLCENISNLSMSLSEIISFCLTQVSEVYFQDVSVLDDVKLPSATLSCFRKNGSNIEVASFGDSPVLLKTKTDLIVLQDEVLSKNEDIAIKALLKAWDELKDFELAKESIRPLLKEFRNSKNTAEGYKVLDLSQKALIGFEERVFNIEEVESIHLVSDGFYRLVDTFHFFTDENFVEKLINYPQTLLLLDELRKLENEKDSLRKYPRLKLSDDASIAFWNNKKGG